MLKEGEKRANIVGREERLLRVPLFHTIFNNLKAITYNFSINLVVKATTDFPGWWEHR